MFKCESCERVLPGDGEYMESDDYGPLCEGCWEEMIDDEIIAKERESK